MTEIEELKQQLTFANKRLLLVETTLRTRAINYKKHGHDEVLENTRSLYRIIFNREI